MTPLQETRELARYYRSFLKRYNRLYDQGWYFNGQRPRNSNEKLEGIRNQPFHSTGIWRKRPASTPPSLKKITAHLNRFDGGRKEDTIFFINEGDFREFICLVDIDSDDSAAADRLARLVAQKYFFGYAIIDRSPGGKGRHVYFKLNVVEDKINRVPGSEIRKLMLWYKHAIQEDREVLAISGAKVCTMLGEPTIWKKVNGLWKIEHRGSVVKAPYFHGDVYGGIPSFIQMKPQFASTWRKVFQKQGAVASSQSSPPPPLLRSFIWV